MLQQRHRQICQAGPPSSHLAVEAVKKASTADGTGISAVIGDVTPQCVLEGPWRTGNMFARQTHGIVTIKAEHATEIAPRADAG